MRRVDRLFQIIQMLRRHRVVKAEQMAEHLECSVRTIYRDIDHLSLSGVPILGEKGVGYRMKRGYDLPPLSFDAPELQAILLGLRMVQSWADPGLQDASASVLDKLQDVLTREQLHIIDDTQVHPSRDPVFDARFKQLSTLRAAINRRADLRVHYVASGFVSSTRALSPLGVYELVGNWYLGAWCHERDDFRTFRVDRLEVIEEIEAPRSPETPCFRAYLDARGSQDPEG